MPFFHSEYVSLYSRIPLYFGSESKTLEKLDALVAFFYKTGYIQQAGNRSATMRLLLEDAYAAHIERKEPYARPAAVCP